MVAFRPVAFNYGGPYTAYGYRGKKSSFLEENLAFIALLVD